MAFLYLIGGLLLLLAGGNYLVSGGVSLARSFKVPTMVIGLTIVAFGTSAPELLVSVKANMQGHPDIAAGNVIGSNIANIGLVLALTSCVFPVVLRRRSIYKDWLVMMGSFVAMLFFAQSGCISFWEGAALAVALVAYIVWSVKREDGGAADEISEGASFSVPLSLAVTAASIGALSVGADLLVKGASEIARHFSVSEKVISVSLVAFGTSVPELATSLVAAFRKEMDISIGNIIGSNIFNVLAVVGITAMVKDISITNFVEQYSIDFIAMFAFSIAIMLAVLPLSRGIFDRWKAAVFVGFYLAYIIAIF
jgi:cation:H+ antiporter